MSDEQRCFDCCERECKDRCFQNCCCDRHERECCEDEGGSIIGLLILLLVVYCLFCSDKNRGGLFGGLF